MIESLVNKIKHYAKAYYEGNSEISDKEFDNLIEELRKHDPHNILLHTTGWGYTPTIGKKVTHPYGGMSSITNKPRSVDKIPDYYRVRLTPKYDGISCAVYIDSGKIRSAVTRGNGEIGIDITDKFVNIVKEIYAPLFTGAIRGELIISRANWSKYKEKYPEAKNPRNVVAGIINRDYVDDDINYIEFHPYKYIADNDLIIYETSIINANSMMENINKIFNTAEDYILCKREELTQDYLRDLYESYNKNYPCDGIVITNNNVKMVRGLAEYEEVAYKFDTDTEVTKVIGIDWNWTRTGKLFPTIKVEPIELDGATISRCSGFNAKFIKDNLIGIGAEITIMKSGGVIPDLQEVVSSVDVPDIPDKCPICGADLEWDGVDLRCSNSECSGTDEADLYNWIFTIAPVHGLGYSIIKSFIDKTQIECVEDLYSRNLVLDGKSATAIKLSEMWNKLRYKSVNFDTALVALNIPRLGWKSAQKIAENVELSKKILEECESGGLTTQVMMEIRSIVKQKTLDSIMSNLDKLERLKFIKSRICIKSNELVNVNKESKGEVVITGKLNTCKRSDFEKIIAEAGYIMVPAIKKGVKYLITNTPDSGSSKNKKAEELGIQKITESEFLEMIK